MWREIWYSSAPTKLLRLKTRLEYAELPRNDIEKVTVGLAGREELTDNRILIDVHSDRHDGSRKIESKHPALMKRQKLDELPAFFSWSASSPTGCMLLKIP